MGPGLLLAYAGTTWHFRLETALLLAELRESLAPTAPPPRAAAG